MPGNDIEWTGINNLYLFTTPKNLTYKKVSLQEAKTLYCENSYLNTSINIWEEERTMILAQNREKEWENIFIQAKNFADIAYSRSLQAKKLAKYLDIDDFTFISDLPCAGAALERLLFKNWENRFFNKALEIHNSGYWICGYLDNNYIICKEVPNE